MRKGREVCSQPGAEKQSVQLCGFLLSIQLLCERDLEDERGAPFQQLSE